MAGAGVLGCITCWFCVVDLFGVTWSCFSFILSFLGVWFRVGLWGWLVSWCFSFSPFSCLLGVGLSCFLGDCLVVRGWDFGGVLVAPLFGVFAGVEVSLNHLGEVSLCSHEGESLRLGSVIVRRFWGILGIFLWIRY